MTRRRMLAAPVTIALFASLFAAATPARANHESRAQLTIYVDAPLLRRGGTVLVVARPIPKADWDRLPARPVAPRFAAHSKTRELNRSDKLFETSISSPVTIIELSYPEGGTFGFDLVGAEDGAHASALRSKRIGVGSGYYVDRRTGQKVTWPDVSTIHVYGPDVDEGQSRRVRVSSGDIMNTGPRRTQVPGVTVYVPSTEQLKQALVRDPS